MTADAFIIAARRTPIGRVGGILRQLRAEDLAAHVLRRVVTDLDADDGLVDEVVLGNVWGAGGNPARLASLSAGFGPRPPGLTVDRQCASGLEAINLATRLVKGGAAQLCLAGGVESPSTAPWRVERPATPYGVPSFASRARFSPDELGDPDVGPAADVLAAERSIGRERQDRFAYGSHRRALAAARSGRFEGELTPLPLGVGAPAGPDAPAGFRLAADESPRERLSERALAGLRPRFTPGGTVTAGNASPINDGAAVVAVASREVCEQLGVRSALRVVDGLAAGVDPTLPGIGPVAAVTELFARQHDVRLGDVDLVEITEAFAAQALACLDGLSIDESRVNVGGGAIALGHPWGASGAVLVTRLFTEMVRRPGDPAPRFGLATLAGAGGIGVATLFERVEFRP